MIAILLRSVLLGIAGLGLLGLARNRSASVRHSIAAGTVVAMLALPVLSLLLPKQSIPVLPASFAAAPAPSPAKTVSTVAMQEVQVLEQPRDWVPFATAIWGVGACALLIRYGFGLVAVGGWVRRSRRIRHLVVESTEVQVPMTVWLGRHVVLFPTGWRDWSGETRRSVLRHELAHIRRGDWFAQTAGQVACALFWPNPLAWLVCRQLRTLAELAADDLVITSGVAPSRYAQDLLEIAQGIQATSPVPSLPFARKGGVARRIEMILKTKVQRGAVTLAGLIMGGLVLAGLSVPIATWALSPRQGPAPATKPGGEPIQINVSCALLAPGVALSGKVPANSVALSIRTKEAERLLKAWQTPSKIVSAPVMRTLSGMTTTVSIGINELEGSTLEITPTYQKDRSITMHVRAVVRSKGKPDDETSADVRVFAGHAALILRPFVAGKPREIRALIRPSVVEPITP